MPKYLVTIWETKIRRVITVAGDSKEAEKYALANANIHAQGPLYHGLTAETEKKLPDFERTDYQKSQDELKELEIPITGKRIIKLL